MWLLKKLNDGSTKYLISESKTYTVGRKNCDFILEEDASISRKHCTIYIAKQNECPFPVNTLTGVWIVDEQSKYGTFLKSNSDWIKINPNQNKKLQSGSIIKFGLIENVWRLEFKPLIACASGVQAEQKKKIETILHSIDGCLKNTWCKECSLVIVNEITLTIKVVLALINGVPIVTPKYVEKVVDSVKNQSELPNYEDYRPAIKESILDASLVSLDIKKNRKELFKGKKFVIPTRKQLETLREVIVSAGGTTELFSSAGKWEKLAEENTILIQLPLNSDAATEEANKSFKEVSSLLKNNYGRRVIPESEIAQAIAYSSTEKYCNPKSTCFNLTRSERYLDSGDTLVQETPEITRAIIPEPCVIPSSATIESQLNAAFQSSDGHEKEESQKSIESRKRTHSQDQLDQEFKAKKARSKKSDAQSSENAVVVEGNTLQKKSDGTEKDSKKVKKNATKMACITSFFQKQSKSITESINQASRNNNPQFWSEVGKSDDCAKRKFPTKSDDLDENSGRKRAKISEGNDRDRPSSGFAIETPREVVETVQEVTKSSDSAPSHSFRKTNNIETESDLADYIEIEKADTNGCVDELNSTIFSLTLISSAYLKDDGSLIDPPSVPVNVKKFKKQKIHSSMMVTPAEQNEDELSDGEWFEPHSGRLNISVGDEEDW